MKNKITVTVSGKAGTGKSTIIALLKNTLIAHNIDIELNIPDGEDSIPCFGIINRRLRDLTDRGLTVTIAEKQTLTAGYKDE